MKMVLFGRCSNAGLREVVGGVFYMSRCEMYFLDRGERSSIFAECFRHEYPRCSSEHH